MKSMLQAEVSAFRFAGGVSREDAGHVWMPARQLTIPERSIKGQLLIFVDLPDSVGEVSQLRQQVIQTIRKTYLQTHGTITTSLRSAMLAANQLLLTQNLQSGYESQHDASVCCLVLRDQEALIARAGPIAVYHLRGTAWKRYHDREAGALIPLGLRKEPEIAFHHLSIAPGDQLLVLDQKGTQAFADMQVRAPAEVLASAALRAAGQQVDFSAMLIEFTGGEARPTAAAPRPAEKAPAAPPPEGEPAAPTRRRAAARPSARPSRPQAGGETARPAAARAGWDLRRIAIITAVLIPLLVIGAVLGYNGYQRYQTRRAFESALDTALENYRTASTTTDQDIAKSALREAQKHLEEALTIQPEEPEAVRLQKELLLLQDKLYKVTPIYFMPELFRFVDPASKPARLVVHDRDIFVLDAGRGVITLHRLNETRDGLQPGAEAAEILRKGQQVGTVVAGNLIDLTWVPAGGSRPYDALCVLDAGGNLFMYANSQLSAQTLPNSGDLKAPLLLDDFTEARIYVLDSAGHQIYRYIAGENGYTQPPDAYFPPDTPVNMTGVRDMSIDGDIWLLFDDRVERYQAGKRVDFALQGLDQPLSGPTALQASFDEATGLAGDNLYIADTGEGRILQFTKAGQFVRQFRPRQGNPFQDLRDFFLDEAKGKLIFLAGSSLYLADVPRE
ncbi:MAG: hypothetical protein H5T60_00355 [Anaerolineae bacterium]|nr:hypothetical protein [Anaerolineae bacterium]